MEDKNPNNENAISQVFEYGESCKQNEQKDAYAGINGSQTEQRSEESASNYESVFGNAREAARIKQANNDMLFGALWCIGGIIATAADIGAIFWGAILFGGFQFFQGLLSK